MPTFFDDAAAEWDTPEKIDRARRVAAALAERVPLTPATTVLDYGCGTGLLAWELGPRVAHVTLADTSEGMLDAARRGAAARDPERYDVIRLDLTAEDAPGRYDLVCSMLALHHMGDIPGVLARMRGALRPDGRVAIADLDHDPDNAFHGGDHDGHPGFERDGFAELMLAAGFVDVEVRTATTIRRGPEERTFDVFLATGRQP